jgi:hypothetical protein
MAVFQDVSWQLVVGLLEIVALVVAVGVTIYQFTRTRASSYIERFNSKDMLECRSEVDGWLRMHSTNAARIEALEADGDLSVKLKQFANLFQELGAAYEFRIANRKTVEVLFDTLIIMYWERLRFWVYDYRVSHDPSLYARFEGLYNAVRSRRGVRQKAEYVVVYGSLMAPESAAKGIGREELHPDELTPVALKGYRRTWSIGERVRTQDGQEVTAIFLDITPDPDADMLALMLPVTKKEMKKLLRREKNYRRIEVTGDLRLSDGRELAGRITAYTFVGEEHHRVVPGDHAVILSAYVDKVAKAARAISNELSDDVRRTADDAGFQQIPGEYDFVDPAQASLV